MRFTTLSTLWIGMAAIARGSPGLRGVPADIQSHRNLQHDPTHPPEWPYAFLISHVTTDPSWCIEAKEGTEDGKNINFSPCRFSSPPFGQLWLLDQDGRIHSRENESRCLTVGDGIDIRSGDRVLFASCNANTEYNKFLHDKTTDQIKVKADPRFCLKQVGHAVQESDTVRTELCTDHDCFTFTYRVYGCSTGYADVECCEDNDCSPQSSCNRTIYRCEDLPECINENDCPIDEQCISGRCKPRPDTGNEGQPVFIMSEDGSAGARCIAASYGIGEFEEIGYEPCDFTNKPAEQLWHFYDEDDTIRSHVDRERCLVVGPGHDLFGGLAVHIASCSLHRFRHDLSGHIHLKENTKYCLTPVGPSGEEKICAKTCENEAKYKFKKQIG